MFDLSWTELLVIAVIAIIVVGPKDLPGALRAVGRWTGKAKRMGRDFQRQFNEALREAEIDTIKKDVEAVGKIDPIGDLRKDAREIEAGLNPEAATKTEAVVNEDREIVDLAADEGTDEPAPHLSGETVAAAPAAEAKS